MYSVEDEHLASISQDAVPLIVDLDGTLIRSDLLIESGMAYVGANPLRFFSLLRALRHGKAALKEEIAAKTPIDVACLPYDNRVLSLINDYRSQGRKVFIASASNTRYVEAVANHIGADGWFASDSSVNLTREQKAQRLVEVFGEQGFDYIGNDDADIPVLMKCRKGWLVHPSRSVRSSISVECPPFHQTSRLV